MKELISVEEAVATILRRTEPIRQVECVLLPELGGRILAESIYADIDQPPFDRSPIDGYACRSADLAGCSKEQPAILQVLEEVDAGSLATQNVGSGEAIRIMTGAPLPSGCDCCVRQEETDYGTLTEGLVHIFCSHQEWENVCFRGEDYRRGTCLLAAGTRLTYVELAILASMGRTTAQVWRKPVITIFTTGDEVIQPGQPLEPGKIYNSNGYLLEARLRELGLEAAANEVACDDARDMAEKLMQAAKGSELILTTGGVSVGKKDIMHEALEIAGADKQFWRVLLKPGTPTIFSVMDGIPVISLSGNPFAAAANFELLVRPLLEKMTGDHSLMYHQQQAVMAEAFSKKSPGRRFVRAILRDGMVYLPEGQHSSGAISSMRGCNCMIDIPAGNPGLLSGDKVTVIVL